jgi:hypothetical protein
MFKFVEKRERAGVKKNVAKKSDVNFPAHLSTVLIHSMAWDVTDAGARS